MYQPFGYWPHRPSLTAPRPHITVTDLTAAAIGVLADHRLPGVTLTLADGPADVPVLLVIEDERQTTVALDHLARQMERAYVPAEPDALDTALRTWLEHRPVTDAHARDRGLAVLDWADPAQTRLTWRVAVARHSDLVLPWAPSADLTAEARRDIEEQATFRARLLPGALNIDGQVALWTATGVPMLSTALLTNPDQMITDMLVGGLTARELHVVIAPYRALACADGDLARRLSGETAEAHRTIPWTAIPDLKWAQQ